MNRNARDLLAYFALAIAFSWVWVVPMAVSGTVVRFGSGWPTHFPALMGPLLAAFAITAWTQGRKGLGDLVARMFRWRVGPRWWLWAVASPLVFFAAGVVAVRIVSGEWPSLEGLGRFNGLPQVGVLGVWALLTAINGLGEETGWRGFALPALQRRFSPLISTLILAPVWAFWHIPYFFVIENYRRFGPGQVAGFVIGLTCGAVVLTWLYNRSGGSILLVTLWHGTYNLLSGTEAAGGLIAAVVSTLVMVQAGVLAFLEARRPGSVLAASPAVVH